jgi:hypothetical protein
VARVRGRAEVSARLIAGHIRFPGPFRLAFRRYGASPEDKKRMLMDITRLGGGRTLPLDEKWLEQIAEESVRRRYPDPHSRARQLAAGRAAKTSRSGQNSSPSSTSTRSSTPRAVGTSPPPRP